MPHGVSVKPEKGHGRTAGSKCNLVSWARFPQSHRHQPFLLLLLRYTLLHVRFYRKHSCFNLAVTILSIVGISSLFQIRLHRFSRFLAAPVPFIHQIPLAPSPLILPIPAPLCRHPRGSPSSWRHKTGCWPCSTPLLPLLHPIPLTNHRQWSRRPNLLMYHRSPRPRSGPAQSPYRTCSNHSIPPPQTRRRRTSPPHLSRNIRRSSWGCYRTSGRLQMGQSHPAGPFWEERVGRRGSRICWEI